MKRYCDVVIWKVLFFDSAFFPINIGEYSAKFALFWDLIVKICTSFGDNCQAPTQILPTHYFYYPKYSLMPIKLMGNYLSKNFNSFDYIVDLEILVNLKNISSIEEALFYEIKGSFLKTCDVIHISHDNYRKG